MPQRMQGGRRFRGVVLPLPGHTPAPPVTTTLAKRVVVASAALALLVTRGRATVLKIPPRAHTQARAPLVVARPAYPQRGQAILLKAPPKHAVGMRALLAQRGQAPASGRAIVFRLPGRTSSTPTSQLIPRTIVTGLRGRPVGQALIGRMVPPFVSVTHPVILLPTSAVFTDGVTSVLWTDGVTSVILVGS